MVFPPFSLHVPCFSPPFRIAHLRPRRREAPQPGRYGAPAIQPSGASVRVYWDHQYVLYPTEIMCIITQYIIFIDDKPNMKYNIISPVRVYLTYNIPTIGFIIICIVLYIGIYTLLGLLGLLLYV